MNSTAASAGGATRPALIEFLALRPLARLQPLLLLGLRLYLAQVFILSGLTKLRDWDTTLLLFSNEYHVPLLPPAVAAVAGTFGETVLPLLLVPGLLGRFAAMGLFVVNAVAVASYPDLTDVQRQVHYFWGALIAVLALFGPGSISVDARLRPPLTTP